MTRLCPRPLLLLCLLVLTCTGLRAEKVADLPIPTHYVNDFAHILSPAGAQAIEDLALQVHQKANAELVVVTINKLEDGQSIEEFTVALEEKWKLGKKGEDRSALIVRVMNPHESRIETGYGLEGMLNDAKVGAILDAAKPELVAGNYDQALLEETQGLANVIAADAHVTLTPTVHTYHRQQDPPPAQGFGLIHIVFGICVIGLLLYLLATGRIGWAFLLLNMFSGGGGGGGGGRDDDEGGGGFGGSGGGSSGGGGASRDF